MLQLAQRLERTVAALALSIAGIALPAMALLAVAKVIERPTRLALVGDALEIQVGLFFALVMNAFAYALAHDAHVRVDVLSGRFSPRLRAWLDILACIFVLAPLSLLLIHFGTEAAWRSFAIGERLGDTQWALQWLVRAAMPLGFALLLLAAAAMVLRRLDSLRTLRTEHTS